MKEYSWDEDEILDRAIRAYHKRTGITAAKQLSHIDVNANGGSVFLRNVNGWLATYGIGKNAQLRWKRKAVWFEEATT